MLFISIYLKLFERRLSNESTISSINISLYKTDDSIQYAIFNRSDYGYWQGIAGGGEDGEIPIESAKREAFEEAGITRECPYIQLDSVSSLPVEDVVGGFLLGDEVYVIKEFSFGVKVPNKHISLSKEHLHYKWLCFEEAVKF